MVTVSGLTGDGLLELWAAILDHRAKLEAGGELAAKRRAQDRKWMWAIVEDRIRARLSSGRSAREHVAEVEAALAAGTISPAAAAGEIVRLLDL